MTRRASEPGRWPASRWIWTVSLVFIVQVGIILYLEKNFLSTPLPSLFRTHIFLAAKPWQEEIITQPHDYQDPTLFALPSLRGFSGRAWLSYRPPTRQLSNWTEAQRWLDLDTNRLGSEFVQFVVANRPKRLRPTTAIKT